MEILRGRWATWSLLAFGFSLAHLFIDFQIGLFGASSTTVSLLQAALAGTFGLLYAAWAHALARARAGAVAGFMGSLVFAAGWAFVVNGVGAVASAPPPSDGFPYQDITHMGSLLFGGLAAAALWRAMKADAGPVPWRAAVGPALLVVAATALEAALAL